MLRVPVQELLNIDGVKVVEELLVDNGHPSGNFVGHLLLTERESEFRSNNVPKIGGNL